MSSHAGYPVRVAVEGHGYRGVPEKMLYEFRVDAALWQEGSAGVPEIVPENRGEARASRSSLKRRLTTFWAPAGLTR